MRSSNEFVFRSKLATKLCNLLQLWDRKGRGEGDGFLQSAEVLSH